MLILCVASPVHHCSFGGAIRSKLTWSPVKFLEASPTCAKIECNLSEAGGLSKRKGNWPNKWSFQTKLLPDHSNTSAALSQRANLDTGFNVSAVIYCPVPNTPVKCLVTRAFEIRPVCQ